MPSAAQLQVNNQGSVGSSVLTSFNNNLTARRCVNATHSPRREMSFIDSAKFSLIQSVPGEDISDPSLEVQQANEAFDEEVFDQNLSENQIIDESIQKIVDNPPLFTKASEVPEINYYDMASFEKLINEIDGREED